MIGVKVNKLQKGTTIIEIDSLELEALQEMFELVQNYNPKFKGKDQLKPRHRDFIGHLNMQLDRSKQNLLAVDKLHALKEQLKDILRMSPEREKGIYGNYYCWDIGYNPERDFGVKLDCAGISLYLSIGCKGSFLSKERQGIAHLYIRPHDPMANSNYIEIDHQGTIEAALRGKSYLIKYLKEQIVAYMAAKPRV
jgi:hypothetical protein